MNQDLRIGNFTSSENFRLLSKEKGVAENYIQECNWERRLGRALEKEENARPLSWGKLVEKRVFDILGTEYTLSSQQTIAHPKIKCWVGTPDGIKEDTGRTVDDIKCPMSLKSFCQLVQPFYDGLTGAKWMDAIRYGYTNSSGVLFKKHKDGEKFYWQLVSNAVLTNSDNAELIIYCPYQNEIQDIRELAQEANITWIFWALDGELPYLLDGGYFKNLNTVRFEVPQEDKEKLTTAIIEASKKLIPRLQLQPA